MYAYVPTMPPEAAASLSSVIVEEAMFALVSARMYAKPKSQSLGRNSSSRSTGACT